MAARAQIFAGLFLICTILPSLASAFADHFPEVILAHDSNKNDVPIHVNNVAHVREDDDIVFNLDGKKGKKLKNALKKKAKKENDKWEKYFDSDLTEESQEDAALVPPTPVVETVTPTPVPVNPTPNPVPVNPTPNPVPVNPTPNPVPVNPTPNPVPVNQTPTNVPAGYPGATLPPVTIGYGGAPKLPSPSDTQTPVPAQPAPAQDHPTPEEIKKQRKKAGLEVGFYEETCPNAEKIIKEGMIRAFGNDSSIAAPIPRLLLHDCFVKGCDASIFLDQTPSGARVEKLATSNGPTVRGFDLIDQIKAELEQECPGIVSCADLLAYLSRDAFVVSGVPHYDVPGGRRDGMESLESNVQGNLPLPDYTVDMLIDLFKRKGLNEEDLVVLIGAHSIGVAHCFSFLYRLDNPQKAALVDPRLAGVMRFTCTSQMSTLAFDTTTQYKMDSIYYKQLAAKRGLLESDVLLSEDPRTKDYIQKFGDDQSGWFNKLGKAMNKLAATEVLTGDQGQIRKQCRAVN